MSKFCPNCGTQVADNANFCIKCGFDFRAVQGAVAAGAAPAASQQVQPQQPVQQSTRPWIQNSGVVNPNPVVG